jgi:hypothetical protein
MLHVQIYQHKVNHLREGTMFSRRGEHLRDAFIVTSVQADPAYTECTVHCTFLLEKLSPNHEYTCLMRVSTIGNHIQAFGQAQSSLVKPFSYFQSRI